MPHRSRSALSLKGCDYLQMDVWLNHRGHGEHKLSALAAGDANAAGQAQCGVKQKSAVRGDLWDNGAAFRE